MPSAVTGFLCLLACVPFCLTAKGESDLDSSGITISAKLSDKYINDMSSRSAEYQSKMEQSTTKYLDKLKAQEQILQQQLSKTNPEAAIRIFNGSQQAYDKLQNDLKNNSGNVLNSYGRYIPGIDSAITSLKFLQQNGSMTGKLGNNIAQVKAAMSKVQALEDQFKKTDNVEDFIKQREAYLRQQLSGYNLPGLTQYNQQAAYYAQAINDFKQDWEDPTRLEQKAIALLNKLPAFQDFMRKNSMIAGLFNIPDDYSTTGIAGLQTRDQVQQLMQQQMQFMGPSGAQTAQQNIGDAQSSLTTMRDKLNKGSSDLAMPDGKGNSQHTKTLFKRIQYGFDMQSTKSNLYFPNQTAFSLTAGYKLDDRNTIGFGIGYSAGWGRDIQHISVTSQGIGLRSFADFKIKGSFYGSGGFEYNLAHPFVSINQLRTTNLWQKSGLIGITKMVSVRSNLVKKTKVQLLWDFLSYSQSPQRSPWVFRVGYNF
jgi:hypothetical protein